MTIKGEEEWTRQDKTRERNAIELSKTLDPDEKRQREGDGRTRRSL